MKLCACICVKVLQLISCATEFILKKLADTYSDRMLRSNQKFLREWTLLNTISLSKETDEFSILTIMGFTFISAVLLITRVIERKSNYHTSEKILLSCGLIFFTIQGLLLFGTVEQLADSVSDYAFSLAGLAFICALLFAIDLIFFREMSEFKNEFSQTDLETTIKSATYNIENYMPKHSNNNKTIEQCCAPKENKLTYLRTDL